MSSSPSLFEIALEAHQAGRLDEAARRYQEIVALQPGHADAWQLLGLVYHQAGQHRQAVDAMRQSLAIDDRRAEVHNNLGEAFRAQGLHDEAVAAYRRALELDPNYLLAWCNQGAALRKTGQLEAALNCYQQALARNPDSAEIHYNRAIALQQTGNLDAAEASYREAVRLKPGFAQAYLNLGAVFSARGHYGPAADSYRQALQVSPDYAPAHNNLGAALLELGQYPEARSAFDQALRLQPDMADARFNLARLDELERQPSPAVAPGATVQDSAPLAGQGLGSSPLFAAVQLPPVVAPAAPQGVSVQAALEAALAHHQAGRLPQAIEIYRRVLEHDPLQPQALHLLGVVAHQQNDQSSAENLIRKAIEIDPSQAVFHGNLGGVYRAQGRLAEAEACCREAIRLKHDYADAHHNLGLVLREQRRWPEAEAAYREAIRLDPAVAGNHYDLSVVVAEQGRIDDAMECCRAALRLDPRHADALIHLGLLQTDKRQLDEAVASFDEALAINPQHPDAHAGRALTWLTQGKWTEGWPEYEWRWQGRSQSPRHFAEPRWDGGKLEEKTILLHSEQGLGDTLQFVRFAPLVKKRVGKVIVECPRPLVELIATCSGIERVVPVGDLLPHFDVQAPLLSVAGLLGITPDKVPAKVPYVKADPKRVSAWKDEIAGLKGFKIGIAWQGNPTFRGDRWRSIPLDQFASLAKLRGVKLISLQKGPGVEQIEAFGGRFKLLDLADRLDVDTPFADTAAVMTHLDLLITSDSALAHLAGALGRPVWVALPVSADWRWLTDRDDSPWYPTMRLFRQQQLGEWEPVFEQIADALREQKRGK